jgi:O-antigen/teichoic acid export membrane protein
MTRTILGPAFAASLVGALALSIVAGFQLADQGPTLGHSILVAALAVPFACLWNVFGAVANARELIVQTSTIRVLVHVVTFLGLLVFVVGLGLHVTGGMLSLLVASFFGSVAVINLVRRRGGRFSLSFDRRLLARALKLGLAIEFAHALLILAARVDVLFVYSITGRAAAGRYSVALTVGQLVASASMATSFALFPRVARIDEEESYRLIAKASRVGIAMSLVSGLCLLVAIPVILPLTFGSAYRGSVLPALILLVSGVLWAEQNLLATSRTARGRTRLQVMAYGSTLLVMVIFDLLLIPKWGMVGAAVAAVISSGMGLSVCVASYHRDAARRGVSLGDFLPKSDDFIFLLRTIPRLLNR